MHENNSWSDVRVFYAKTGLAKYVSHLDTVRVMTRAIKRTALPVWYTEGFNPHIFLTFARPLSLGQESLCESFDFRLCGEATFKEIANRLNEALPEGFQVTAVGKPDHSPRDIAFADFKAVIECQNPNALADRILSVYNGEKITVMKKGKQGRRKVEKEIDIKPHISEFKITPEADTLTLNFRLTAGETNSVNPSLLIGALTESFDGVIGSVNILKLSVMLENGERFS